MEKSSFGSLLKSKRMEAGLSVRELSRRTGISHPYLSQIENGKTDNPSVEVIYQLLSQLGLDFVANEAEVKKLLTKIEKIANALGYELKKRPSAKGR